MKYVEYSLFLIFTYIFLSINVYADTCSYKDQTILNNDLINIKITYEVVNDNEINILMYNITDNIYISYIEPLSNTEVEVFYINTDNGKYVIKKDTKNLEQYDFKIRSNISDCYGNILSTKKIIKPKYNSYHELELCDNLELSNHSLCQKFTTIEIKKTKSEVINTLEEFLANKVKEITTTKKDEEATNVKTVVTFSFVGIVIIGIIITIVLLNKKRGEL